MTWNECDGDGFFYDAAPWVIPATPQGLEYLRTVETARLTRGVRVVFPPPRARGRDP